MSARIPWTLEPCASGGLVLIRGGGKYREHPQTHLQIVPAEDARLMRAAPGDVRAAAGDRGGSGGRSGAAALDAPPRPRLAGPDRAAVRTGECEVCRAVGPLGAIMTEGAASNGPLLCCTSPPTPGWQ